MNKTELIKAIAEKTGETQKVVDKIVEVFKETVVETVKKGEEVALIGFGSFGSRENKERNGIHPQTREPLKIKASKTPTFKAGKSFKEGINA